MRRLDWFLAAVVASFLIGALAMAATGGWPAGEGLRVGRGFAPSDVSIRHLASRIPALPSLPGEAR
jgi:hypothetical protein